MLLFLLYLYLGEYIEKDQSDGQTAEFVTNHLYNNGLDPQTAGAVKLDLEYVAHHWQDTNFDLWEEISGHYCYSSATRFKGRGAPLNSA